MRRVVLCYQTLIYIYIYIYIYILFCLNKRWWPRTVKGGTEQKTILDTGTFVRFVAFTAMKIQGVVVLLLEVPG
jgi:hypothetical protein